MQLLPVRETMSRAERNKRLKRTKKGEDESPLVPEEFDSYQRTENKVKGQGVTAKPAHTPDRLPIPFRGRVEFGERGTAGKNKVFRHNTRVSLAPFATYPSSRGICGGAGSVKFLSMLDPACHSAQDIDYRRGYSC
ncbi:hypothetical protein PHMEG_00039756 [Phytophthora megakarya]|uniref:Uncharacterized protein n=1 Tax=Phytophthora megakarya TaxID=4795 RepID=A0A225UF41_9STRA|nr:hypothetical protein PHMEG_00039756 [Phytophthora megakarya]